MATKVSKTRSTPKTTKSMAGAKASPKAARPAGRVARFEHQLAVALKGAARDTGSMVKGLGHEASVAGRKLAKAVGLHLHAAPSPARKGGK